MANTTIKITQLPSIGNGLTASTILPVVNLTGTATTDKVAVGNIANFTLLNAGNSLPPAYLSTLAYSVVNAAQPNITSVGTLSVNTLKISGGSNGYYLQTDGTGNLSWAAGGNGGNSTPGGSNSQVQFNSNGAFAGSSSFTFDSVNNKVNINTLAVSSNIIANGNITANFFIGNGSQLTGITTANANFASYAGNVTVASQSNITSLGNLTGLQSNGAVFINNNTNSTSNSTGALRVSGGIGATGNIHSGNEIHSRGNIIVGGNTLFVGPTAEATGLINPAMVIFHAGDQYIQAALKNSLSTGSADWVSYGDNGTESQGWADMGFTSSEFNDANYTITGPGDGYLFVETFAGSYGGNLVLATGNLGTVKDIIFATNGFLANKEFGRISHSNNSLKLTRAGATITFPDGSIQNTAYTGSSEVSFPLSNGNSNFNIATANGNATVTAAGTSTWTFGTNGTTTFPANTLKAINGANAVVPSTVGTAGAPLTITAGTGGVAATNLNAGNGGNLTITAGDAGSDIGNPSWGAIGGTLVLRGGNSTQPYTGSNVEIHSGNSASIPGAISLYTGTNQWTFDATGNLILSGGNSVIQSIANSSLDTNNPNVSTMVLTPDQNYSSQSLVLDPTSPGHIHLRAPGANIDQPVANLFLGGETSSFEVGYYTNTAPNLYIHSDNKTWTFDSTGNLTFPRNAPDNIDPILTIVSGATPTIQSTDASLLGLANLALSADYLNISGNSGAKVVVYADSGEIISDGGIILTTNNANAGNTKSWSFDGTGSLSLAPISLGVNLNEETVIQSQRKIIPSNRYSAVISGTTPTVVYTATDFSINSMKVTIQIQHQNLGFEMFDVNATKSGANTYYTVTNRLQPPTIDNTSATVGLNGSSAMQITLTVNSGAANSWVTYDSTEFGIPVD
jgi:hypothetical protein